MVYSSSCYYCYSPSYMNILLLFYYYYILGWFLGDEEFEITKMDVNITRMINMKIVNLMYFYLLD